MCFSASASFVAGGGLSAIGVATLRSARRREEIAFALVPFFFGVQQTIEGVIWLTFGSGDAGLRQTMATAYSVFSHVFWPIYVPFAVWFLEREPWRRRGLIGFQAAGLAVGLYLLYSLIARPIVAELDGSHIVYVSPHFYLLPVMLLYLAATCVSGVLSSHRFVALFGALGFLFFVASLIIHARAFVSIWCFFYAILSAVVYVHLRYRGLGGFPGGGGETQMA